MSFFRAPRSCVWNGPSPSGGLDYGVAIAHVAPGQSKGQITGRQEGFLSDISENQSAVSSSPHMTRLVSTQVQNFAYHCAFSHAISSAWSSLPIPFCLLPLPHNFQDISSLDRNPPLCPHSILNSRVQADGKSESPLCCTMPSTGQILTRQGQEACRISLD